MTDLEWFVERMKEAAGDTWVEPKRKAAWSKGPVAHWGKGERHIDAAANKYGRLEVCCSRMFTGQTASAYALDASRVHPEALWKWLQGDLRLWNVEGE